MNIQKSRYESKSLLEKLGDLDGAQIKTINEVTGDYSIRVNALSVKYVTDLIGVYLGSGNFDIKYDAPTVKYTVYFNILGKKRLTI